MVHLFLRLGRKKKQTSITQYLAFSCKDYLKALFSMLVDREIIKENPFKGIKKQKEVITKQNIAFTDKEMELLKNSICHQDKELWLLYQPPKSSHWILNN